VVAVEGMFMSLLQSPHLPKNYSRKQHRLVSVADICAKLSILVQMLQ